MESINPFSISVAVVDSMLSNSWSKNIGFIRTRWRDIVETISLCWLGVGCGMHFSFWRNICLMLSCPLLLFSVSSYSVAEKVNSVWYGPARTKAFFMNESSSFSETEIVLVDFVCKLSIKSSFFAVLFNSIYNILDHISFISRCRPLFVSSFKIIFRIIKSW